MGEIDRQLDAIIEAQNAAATERTRALHELREAEIAKLVEAGAVRLKNEIARCERERDLATERLAHLDREDDALDRVEKIKAKIAGLEALGADAPAGELAAARRQLGPAKVKAGIPKLIIPLLRRRPCPLRKARISVPLHPRDREMSDLEHKRDRAERELRLFYGARLRLRHTATRARLEEHGDPALYCRRRGCPNTIDREMAFYDNAPPFCSLECGKAHAVDEARRARTAAVRSDERVCGGCNRSFTGGPPPITVCADFEPHPDDVDYTAGTLIDLCSTECALSVAIDCERSELPALDGVAYVRQPDVPDASTAEPDTADRALALLRRAPEGLRTKDVAERLGVTRTTTDSALRQLAQRRLVTGGGRGAGRGGTWRVTA